VDGEELKYLEDQRGKHKGEEIWVIGAGPSLDDYPTTFFKDKICIEVNWVFSVFVDIGDGLEKFDSCAFYSLHSHAEHAYWIRDHIPHFLKSCFFISHPLSYRNYRGLPYCCPEDFNEDPYWIRNSANPRVVRATDAEFRTMAACIMARRDDCRYLCQGTTLHWAIEVAVVLGAKKIYVAGQNGQHDHMHKHGSMYKPVHRHKHVHPYWRKGTRSLAKAFKPYGIEIASHYYGKGQ